MQFTYKHSIVGGTFDHFHQGHEFLLREVFAASEHVFIGLTTEKLYGTKLLANAIENYASRESSLKTFLKENNLSDRAEILPIDDFYGNTLTEESVDAIFATEETKHNVQIINRERVKRGLSAVDCIVVPFVLANDNQKITSERIRQGEIDREGNVYLQLFQQKDTLLLPEFEREEFKKPVGILLSDIHAVSKTYADVFMIAVGDVVSLSLFKQQQQAAVSVVDFKTRREAMNNEDTMLLKKLLPQIHTENHQGTIQREAVECLKDMIDAYLKNNLKQTLVIAGEEDLLVIPAVLLAPLHAVVIYGQFDQGIVCVEITEKKKQEMVQLMKKFE